MKLKILDTGYVSNISRSEQTRLDIFNRAGYDGASGVSEFILNVKNIGISGNVSLENKPIVNSLKDDGTTLISSNNRIIPIALIKKKEFNTSGYQYDWLIQLLRLERTKGVKLLYPSSLTDTKKSIIEILGTENIGGYFGEGSGHTTLGYVSSTTPYLVGRINNMKINDNEDSNYFIISFNFELTGDSGE